EGLRLVVQKFVEDGAKADLKRWLQTIEVTASRAGLLLCADLEIAKKIIAAEPQLPGDLTPQDKLKELIVFSVSEQYFALRAALVVGPPAAADVVVQDPTVSSRHCALTVLGTGVKIEDLSSRNGTYVGNARVGEAWGGPGTMVTLGHSTLVLWPVRDATDAH